MAGTSSRLSRKELKFIVDDIGAEIIPLLEPEDVVKGMNAQKRKKLVSLFDPEDVLAAMSVEDRLSGINSEELLKGITPEQRKMLFELVLKQLASDLAGKEPNGHSDN